MRTPPVCVGSSPKLYSVVVPARQTYSVASTYSLTWEDSAYAQPLTDLYFGLGGFTVKSSVEVLVQRKSGNLWDVTFSRCMVQVRDDYNWDQGKSVYVPGWGKIDDVDALRVERAGRVKSFLIESQPWQEHDPTITGPATMSV